MRDGAGRAVLFSRIRAAARALAAAVLAIAFGCASPGPAQKARMASGNERPGPEDLYSVEHFRIGWYDDARNPDTPARLKEAGFDSVMPYTSRRSLEDVKAFLAAAQESGISVHLDIPRSHAEDPSGDSLKEYVRAVAGSPALLSWYLYDEPEWKLKARPGNLEAGYSLLKSLDPGRDVDLVFILPSLAGAYRGAMDRIWIDYYPVAKGSSEFAALRGGRYADRMKAFGRRADRYGLPLTLVLQGYGEREDGKPQFGRRLPTPSETRYMFWASFLGRPEEILYWTLYRTQDEWFQAVLSPIVREFRKKFPDSVEYRPASGFKISGVRADAILLGNGRGSAWLLVLSREGTARTLEAEAPEGYGFVEGLAGLSAQVRRPMGPYGVELIDLEQRPSPEPIQ